MEEKHKEVLMMHAASSAMASGLISSVLLQPFDFAKTRIQVASHPKNAVAPAAPGLVSSPASRQPGLVQLVTWSVRQHGVLVLWRGTIPSVCRVVPGVTLYFTTLNSLQRWLVPEERHIKAHEAALMAFGARCFSAVCLLPLTVVKTHFESGKYDKLSMRKILGNVYRKAGLRGLYSGLGPTLARDAPFSSLYFMFYSELKRKASTATGKSDLSPGYLFLCGTVASCMATLITQPADVLKTRRQMFPWERISYFFLFKDIYKNEGIQGIFRGVLPRLMRRAGMASLSWTLFDTLKQRL